MTVFLFCLFGFFLLFIYFISSELIEEYCEYLLPCQVWNQDYYKNIWNRDIDKNRRILKDFFPQKFFAYNNWIAQFAIVIKRKNIREIFHGLSFTEGSDQII